MKQHTIDQLWDLGRHAETLAQAAHYAALMPEDSLILVADEYVYGRIHLYDMTDEMLAALNLTREQFDQMQADS